VNEPDEAAQDAAWQEIVANFGERVELADDVPAAPVFGDDIDEPFEPHPEPDHGHLEAAPDSDPEPYDDIAESERFIAPRPPLPHTTPDRLVAWLGVLGAPLLAVVLFVLHATLGWYIASWIVDLLVIAFLSGFGYLVFHMPREPRDPWDDGARL